MNSIIKQYDWQKYFVKNMKPRPIQIKAIDSILNAFLNEQNKYVILQAPTGTGKSAIAYTVNNFLNHHYKDDNSVGYILTTQLILQNQYKKEFPNLANIYSKRNINCEKYSKLKINEVDWIHKYIDGNKCNDCPYSILKSKFLNNNISVTNTNWFFCNLEYSQMLKYRNIITVDEAHNLSDNICNYKGIVIEYKLLKKYGFDMKLWPNKNTNLYDWFVETLSPQINTLSDIAENKIESFKNNQLKLNKLLKCVDYLDKLKCQINRILPTLSLNDWVFNYDNSKITVTPLYANNFSYDSLFKMGKHILLMSGTILNDKMFAKELGIFNYKYINLNHTFPIKNRKIYFTNSAKMSYKHIKYTFNILIKDINKLINYHNKDKGVIHTNSHKMAKNIYNHLNNDRCLIVDNFKNRDDMLNYHFKSNKPTILISPSLHEGVDLKNTLSRFQIITKIPFGNLGDNYTNIKKDKIKWWYAYTTIKKLIQSYGRSIRSVNDFATTYILDSDFKWFFDRNKNTFPKYFKEALTNKSINEIII